MYDTETCVLFCILLYVMIALWCMTYPGVSHHKNDMVSNNDIPIFCDNVSEKNPSSTFMTGSKEWISAPMKVDLNHEIVSNQQDILYEQSDTQGDSLISYDNSNTRNKQQVEFLPLQERVKQFKEYRETSLQISDEDHRKGITRAMSLTLRPDAYMRCRAYAE